MTVTLLRWPACAQDFNKRGFRETGSFVSPQPAPGECTDTLPRSRARPAFVVGPADPETGCGHRHTERDLRSRPRPARAREPTNPLA
jgi:hypothetical protein